MLMLGGLFVRIWGNYMMKSIGRAPRFSTNTSSILSGFCLSLVIAACVALSGCNPMGTKSQAPTPNKNDTAEASAAQGPSTTVVTNEGWVTGPNSDHEIMFWKDGLGQNLEFRCADEVFTVQSLSAKTVKGAPNKGRLYLGDASIKAQAKVYSGKANEVGWNNSFYFSVPFTDTFLKDLETAHKIVVEVGQSRVTPNMPPESVLKEFITECNTRWEKSKTEIAPEILPFPEDETVNAPEAAMSAAASSSPVSAWVFRDPLIKGGFGPQMVALPAGKFMMGSPKSDPKAAIDETQHPVTIAYQFAIGQYQVTVYEYLSCVAAGGCKIPQWQETNREVDPLAPKDPYEGLESSLGSAANPVVGISWHDAKAYAAWLSRTTGKTYRLSTEAEWEYAARAGSTTIYPWGDKIGVGKANCFGCGSRWDSNETSPVGSFAPNGFGLYDMIGNVEQLVEDCDAPYSPAHPSDGSAFIKKDCFVRLSRGGSYLDWTGGVRTASRTAVAQDNRNRELGFRIARSF